MIHRTSGHAGVDSACYIRWAHMKAMRHALVYIADICDCKGIQQFEWWLHWAAGQHKEAILGVHHLQHQSI